MLIYQRVILDHRFVEKVTPWYKTKSAQHRHPRHLHRENLRFSPSTIFSGSMADWKTIEQVQSRFMGRSILPYFTICYHMLPYVTICCHILPYFTIFYQDQLLFDEFSFTQNISLSTSGEPTFAHWCVDCQVFHQRWVSSPSRWALRTCRREWRWLLGLRGKTWPVGERRWLGVLRMMGDRLIQIQNGG